MTTYIPHNPAQLMDDFDDASPQQAFQELTKCPFVRPTGQKVVAKRDDIVKFTRHPAVRTVVGTHFTLGAKEALIPLDLDGDEHRKYRKLLDPLFTPRKVEPLRASIRALTNSLIDEFIDNGEVELFESFCQRLPSQIFMDLLGLPQEDVPQFLDFKDAVVRPVGDTPDELEAYKERAGEVMTAYLDEVFDAREASGELGDDLIGGFLRAEVDGRKLTRSEMSRLVYLLIIAGLDTVASSLSCMFNWLAQHSEERARLVADPSLVPSAVEELLRYESPVYAGTRYVTEDITVNGRDFEAGDEVEVVWAAGNVDPEAFDDPLEVDLQRKHNVHVGFAAGPHRCLGSNLARLELAEAIATFHERIPDYWITPGREPEYINYAVRLAVPLPLSFPKGGSK